MNDIILVCIILITVSFVIGTIYFILAMIQMAKTARKAEEALDRVNSEMELVQKVSSSVVNTMKYLPNVWIKTAAWAVPVISSLLFKKNRRV